MAKKKKQVTTQPSNIKDTTDLRETIVDYFSEVSDPRVDRTKRHKLLDVIFIAIAAAICGADNWKAIQVFADAKREWLETILELPNGIPSHATFWRIFRRIDPSEFQKCFVSWIQAVFDHVDGDIIAIDGKTMRGSGASESGSKPLHIVSAWAAENDITLAQVKVEEKTNEITAIPTLLNMIAIQGATVTIDAMGCQKGIADQIITNGGNYVLALKGNQSSFHDEVENFFLQALAVDFEGIEYDCHTSLNKDHGRIESRKVYVTGDLSWLPQKHKWTGLMSIAMIVRERVVKGKTSKEIQYYFSSLTPDAEQIAHAIRTHWGVENKVHWILDVIFKEDNNQLSGEGAENFSLLSKIALNLLKQERTARLGISNKRFKASIDHSYLEAILKAVA